MEVVSDEFIDALGADVVIPVTPLSVYQLRQQIVRLEAHVEECHRFIESAVTIGARSCRPGDGLDNSWAGRLIGNERVDEALRR